MLEGVRVHTVVSRVHHVVVASWHAKAWIGGCSQFEGFVAATGRNDRISGSYCWNDVLDHALSHGICDSLDVVLLSTTKCLLKQPSNVLWVVSVQRVACIRLAYNIRAQQMGSTFSLFVPLDDMSPLDAMLWLARDSCECA